MKNGLDSDSIDLERLVRLVMTDLGVTGGAALSAASRKTVPNSTESVPSASSAASDSTRSDSVGQEDEEDELAIRLTAHVITLDQIRQSMGNRPVRRIFIPGGAVVTPSAKDEAKKRGLELIYGGQPSGPSATPATSAAPYSLSASNVPVTAAAKSTLTTLSASSISASAFSAGARRRFPVSTGSATPSPALGNLVLAFHALPLETIPKNFLDTLQKSQSVTLFRSDCVLATADRLSEALAKPENKGILLTGYSAIASAVCNRRFVLRGLVGYDLPQMESDAASLGANLLILDPDRAGFFRLRQMITRFAALGAAVCPSAVRKGLEP